MKRTALNRKSAVRTCAAGFMIALALAATQGASAADARTLEAVLANAMRYDANAKARAADSGVPIRDYRAAGYLARRPNARVDYTDYWWLVRPASFMGHRLVMIEEEYMSQWVGCCVSPGIGITVALTGSPAALEQFAHANRCAIDTNADIRDAAQLSHVVLPAADAGRSARRYATLSCRERDEQ